MSNQIREIAAADREVLAPLFRHHRYDTVLIRSVLEGHFGTAHADSGSTPTVARLDSGAFTLLAGHPEAPATPALLRHAPIAYVTPENDGWRDALVAEFGNRISPLPFTAFAAHSLDQSRLAELARRLPAGFDLRVVDRALAERLPSELGNPTMIENFRSLEDFERRGAGYCVVHEGRVVSAATSMARCRDAIDIEIETRPEFQRQGLGTAVGARLVLHCLQVGIEPHWLAANAASERLALRLGFEKRETYETFEIKPEAGTIL
jgi:GNAT superfamily N-acetyltransferase